jgi:Glycosyl transferase family 11
MNVFKKRKDLLTLEIMGGLGNQLFQVAALAYLSETQGFTSAIGFSRVSTGFSPRVFEIPEKMLNILMPKIELNHHENSLGLILKKISWNIESRLQLSIFSSKYISPVTGFDINLTKKFKKSLLSGYFQTFYYANFLEWRKKFSNFDIHGDLFEGLRLELMQSEAICMHIRGGDFLLNSSGNGNLSSRYFFEALKVSGSFGKMVWIFTDDLEYAKNLVAELPIVAKFVDEERELSPFETLLLMSNAKQIIISNSTFAWWGAFLSEFSNIYAPAKWFESKEDPALLIPDHWIRVKSLWTNQDSK